MVRLLDGSADPHKRKAVHVAGGSEQEVGSPW